MWFSNCPNGHWCIIPQDIVLLLCSCSSCSCTCSSCFCSSSSSSSIWKLQVYCVSNATCAKIGINCSFMKVFILHEWAYEQLNCSFAQMLHKKATLCAVCKWNHSDTFSMSITNDLIVFIAVRVMRKMRKTQVNNQFDDMDKISQNLCLWYLAIYKYPKTRSDWKT